MRRHQLTGFILLATIVVTLEYSPAQVTDGYRVFTITFATSNPNGLAINRGRLAWQDDDVNTGLHFIKYYSGASITTLDSGLTGATIGLGSEFLVWNTAGELVKAYDLRYEKPIILGESYNPDGKQPVDVNSGIVVYAVRSAGTGSVIAVHRLLNNSDTMLSAAVWNTSPTVHQGQIAWVAADSEGASVSSNIFLFDGRATTNISRTVRTRNTAPILRDGGVAWLQADSVGSRVRFWFGDTLRTVDNEPAGSSVCTGYDVSDGIAVAAFNDTTTGRGRISLYDAEHDTALVLSDSNGVRSPHISNGLAVWQSGTGADRRLQSYDVRTSAYADISAGESPVIDHDILAWTFGDAVELRRYVTNRKLTSDGMNGWEQTKFKTIDSNKVIWGNFANSPHMRMFSWDGSTVSRLSDSSVTTDLVVANDGLAVWRVNFDSLYYSDWVHPPVKFLDTIQAENPLTAGGSISFHGTKLTVNDQVQYPWLYDTKTGQLIQLSMDSTNAGDVYCDGKTACWENLSTQRLLFYDGTTTVPISDSAIAGDYEYRNGLIVWTQERGGAVQVFSYDVQSKTVHELTTGGTDKYRPMTDGTNVLWFENAVFSGKFVDGDLVYLSDPAIPPTRIHHVPSRTTSWNSVSNADLAWASNGSVVVYDGDVISQIVDGSGYYLTDAHVDKGFVEWRRMQQLPATDSGDIYLGTLHPHAAFDADNVSGSGPLAVAFTNRSWEDARTYLWDFGDGTTSTERSPMHSYATPGKYSVTLTVAGNGFSSSERKYALVRVASTTSATSANPSFPATAQLYQNYPNPFNPTTVVSGQWPVTSFVRLVVYDVLGREVAVLADGQYPPGRFSFTFDASGLASGVYFCRLTAGNSMAVRQMLLIK